jgi:hypothetical protein
VVIQILPAKAKHHCRLILVSEKLRENDLSAIGTDSRKAVKENMQGNSSFAILSCCAVSTGWAKVLFGKCLGVRFEV